MRTLIRWAVERPKAVVAAWLLLLVAAVPFALKLNGGLQAGGFSDPRGASVAAQRTLDRAFHEAPNSLLVVLHDDDGHIVDAVSAARGAIPTKGVSRITDHRTQPDWLSKDGRTTFLQVGYTSDNATVQNLVPALRTDVAAEVPGRVQVNVTGAPALDYALNVHSAEDVTRAEMIAFPVLFVVLLLVFRSVAAMAVPLVMAGFTLGITEGIGYGMTRVTDVNSLFTNIVSMVGLAVTVDYSLFIVKRYREELEAGRAVPEAIERSMRTVGHSVVFSGLAVAVAMSALFIPRAMSFTSIALGGVAVTAIAVAVATTPLPAVLRLRGHRISWGTLRLGRSTPAKPAAARRPGGFVAARPGLLLAALVVGFAALAFPAARLTLQVPVASATILPADDQARVGLERIQHDIGLREMFPVQVVLTAPSSRPDALVDAVRTVAHRAAKTPGAATVSAVTTLGLPAASTPAGPGGPGRRAVRRDARRARHAVDPRRPNPGHADRGHAHRRPGHHDGAPAGERPAQ
jgi:putative drug exporter of the RND superfamily